MAHTLAHKKPLLTRVRRLKGQVEGLERALDQETDCLSVLQQIAAVRGAVNGLMAEVLEGHIREHLVGQTNDAAVQRELEGVLAAVRSYLK